MDICADNNFWEKYCAVTLEQKKDRFYDEGTLRHTPIDGFCWTPFLMPKTTIAYTSTFTWINIIENFQDKKSAYRQAFAGFFCDGDLQLPLGVIFPFLARGVEYPDTIKNSRYRLKKLLLDEGHVLSYNPNHKIHPPFERSLKDITHIISILPGQIIKHNEGINEKPVPLDDIFAGQFQPALDYIINDLKGTPLSWNQQHLFGAVKRIVEGNREDWVAAKMHPQPIPQFVGAQNYAAVAV